MKWKVHFSLSLPVLVLGTVKYTELRDNNWASFCSLEVLGLMIDALPAEATFNPHFPKAQQEMLKLQTKESSIKERKLNNVKIDVLRVLCVLLWIQTLNVKM